MTAFQKALVAGAVAGVFSLAVVVPVELLKCRAQMNRASRTSYADQIALLYSRHGITGLYRGFWATALRDIPSWPVFFASYAELKEFGRDAVSGRPILETMHAINAGGVASVLCWIVCLPQDIIKNK